MGCTLREGREAWQWLHTFSSHSHAFWAFLCPGAWHIASPKQGQDRGEGADGFVGPGFGGEESVALRNPGQGKAGGCENGKEKKGR